MKYKIIFTLDMNDEDAYYRECRNDVLIQDENDNFFELNFETLDAIIGYFKRDSKFYYWPKLVIIENVKKQSICNAIIDILSVNTQKAWSPLSKEYLEKHYYPKENWEIFEVEVNG